MQVLTQKVLAFHAEWLKTNLLSRYMQGEMGGGGNGWIEVEVNGNF